MYSTGKGACPELTEVLCVCDVVQVDRQLLTEAVAAGKRDAPRHDELQTHRVER